MVYNTVIVYNSISGKKQWFIVVNFLEELPLKKKKKHNISPSMFTAISEKTMGGIISY